MLSLFAGLIGITLAALLALRFTRYRHHPWDIHYPKLAWLRAGIYFCLCHLVSYASGAMALLLSSPVATAEQLADQRWWLATAGVYAFILFAYACVWSYFTPVFERRRHVPISALFGLLWGLSSGQLFLSVWVLAGTAGLPDWGRWLATFLVLSAWQPNWHSIYWDHYIAPEHDTPMTQKIKALGCHIPNLIVTLTWLMHHDNALLFVGTQVVACTSAAIGMRYPAPWDAPSALNYAPRSTGRIPRCTGYIPTEPRSDPYTPFYPGWRRN